MEYLCKCNNCDTILIDENPQVGAVKQLVPAGAESMEQNTDGETYWCCPKCRTDAYLIDM
jgi:uncharacterized C2H2 Zn-finger protein